MKVLFFIICLFTVTLSTQAWSGTDIQNGGGGLSINGNVATFYSAKINIDPEPMESFVEIQNLNQELFNLKIVSPLKLLLLNNTTPSYSRKYFRATDSNSLEDIESIKDEYMRATGISSKNIVLFALTNVEKRTTLLLPDFFKLNPIEKMTILFHESMWLSKKVNSLPQMLRLEYVFQQYLENKSTKNIFEFYRNLEETFSYYDLLLKAVFQSEIEKYNRQPNAPILTLDKILSKDAIAILAKYFLSGSSLRFGTSSDILNELAARAIMEQNDNPAFRYTLISLAIHIPNNLLTYKPCILPDSLLNLLSENPKEAANALALSLQKVNRISVEGNGFIVYKNGSEEILLKCYQRSIGQ